MKIRDKKFILSNGVEIPAIGFGTWQSKDGEEAYNAVKWALKHGYTHIDTARSYGNEASVARAIKESCIKREDLFITTKLLSDVKSYDGAIECFNKSLEALATDYVDLYLIHAPWPWYNVGLENLEGNAEAWRAMVDLYKAGKVRAIGVSNFNVSEIEYIVSKTNFKPMVNQIRFFVGNTQNAITGYCKANDILIEAYSPMATGSMLEKEEMRAIAEKYNTSIAKI